MLVAAPTGSGKTLVAEYAIAKSLAAGTKTFYTTPLKALSNQKYGDLVRAYGADQVGLLTGDNAINGDAPIVVMTTEVLRNMIYAGSPTLEGLRNVVLDEVHYLQDPSRGAVWEEVIIHLPADIDIVALSATVSNAEEVAAWMQTVRGETEAIIEERRPVELVHLYMVGDRSAEQLHLLPTFTDQSGESAPEPSGGPPRPAHVAAHPGPAAAAVLALAQRGRGAARGRADAARDRVRVQPGRLRPGRRSVRRRGPATDRRRPSAATCARSRNGTSPRSPTTTSTCSATTPGSPGSRPGSPRTTPGMVPPMKEAVEEAFAAGLLKVVFATETLSLGINMPARSVVIEKLSKFTGEHHEFLTPGEYTQLAGARAGAASTTSATSWCCGTRSSRSNRWPGSRHAAPTRSRRRSARRTTWPRTSCAGIHPNRRGTC